MLHTAAGFRFSATDLSPFADCEHLAWLEGQAALGLREPPGSERDPMARLLAERGKQHEQAYLAELEAAGRAVTHIAYQPDAPDAAIAATREAMRRGDHVIYQAVLEDGRWFGIADFLERVERPSALGAWGYEAADAKLARRTKASYLLQLSLYSELIAAVQGALPERMHVILGAEAAAGGDGKRVRRDAYATRDFAAYFHALQRRFEGVVAAPGEPSYPLPVEFCNLCRWEPACAQRRERDDHLCRVANIRRVQITRLESAGVTTMAGLGAWPEGAPVPRIPRETLDRLRAQARLQRAQLDDGKLHLELLPPLDGKGFAILPAPSPGDVFFDMEGDPYFEGRGLEYLFGADFAEPVSQPGAVARYRAWWAHDRAAERKAFESFIDFVVARRAADPAMHVYHYAPYEPSALKRLAGHYGTREAELDDLLRHGALVDLYTVVRQGLRASTPSYSIKDIEHFYMGAREAAVTSAGGSIVEYELWLSTREQARLDGIEHYNKEDCVSTRLLRDWLLARKEEAYAKFGPPPPPPDEPETTDRGEKAEERERIAAEHSALVAALTRGLDGDPGALTGEDRGRWLLAQLLDYHQRESRPAWWMFFSRMEMTDEELISDTEAIGGLAPDPDAPPFAIKKSTGHAMRFPAQELKLGAGADVFDPATGKSAGTIESMDVAQGRLVLKRGPKLAGVPLPRALMAGGPYNTKEQRAALRRVAARVVGHGLTGAGPFRAVRELLLGGPPRVSGILPGGVLQGAHLELDDAWRVVNGLMDSAVFVQGPPGAGKTWLGARLIVRLLRAGKRVGVTAVPHRVIHNLLHEVEKVAHDEGFTFVGLKKRSGDGDADDETAFHSRLAQPCITNTGDNPEGMPAGVQLLAGTAWLFARAPLDRALDYLFIDEAGQVSLADALAVGTSAANLVLLGDPQQLAQVSQAVHPEGAEASVLQHVLGEHDTIPAERGLFLERSWRMHPDVCDFISELAYEGRLVAAPDLERQAITGAAPPLAGAGLRWLPVEHDGNAQRSPEEARRIAQEIERLLTGGKFTDSAGVTRALTPDDILVVAPYNAQVQELAATLPGDVQVGTVDKFQGREAPVVFFSMASSTGDDLPHGLEFLFSRKRLNVAVSRAKALAVLVASPRLLEARCKTADEMRMVNGVCRFVERAAPSFQLAPERARASRTHPGAG